MLLREPEEKIKGDMATIRGRMVGRQALMTATLFSTADQVATPTKVPTSNE